MERERGRSQGFTRQDGHRPRRRPSSHRPSRRPQRSRLKIFPAAAETTDNCQPSELRFIISLNILHAAAAAAARVIIIQQMIKKKILGFWRRSRGVNLTDSPPGRRRPGVSAETPQEAGSAVLTFSHLPVKIPLMLTMLTMLRAPRVFAAAKR